MRFGIYPGGRAGTTCARPADPARIAELVGELAGAAPFVVREYVHFFGADPRPGLVESLGAEHELAHLTMPDDWYVQDGRELDLVVSYLPERADVPGWLAFLDAVLDRYGHLLRYLQVTLEPNFPLPLIDGSSPGVLAALTEGIPYARRRADSAVRVGFSVAEPAEWLGGDAAFWAHLAGLPARDFAGHVDYVGLGLYPDAFGPSGDLRAATAHALRHLREDCLPQAHIGATTPLHVAENGSPHGAGSLATMLDTVREHGPALNITQYELFSLSDADSASAEPLGHLGLVTDGYARKPAFDWYRDVIRQSAR